MTSRGCPGGSTTGIGLLEVVLTLALALVAVALVGAALPPVLDVAAGTPEAVDLAQRARAAQVALGGMVSRAGAGADLVDDRPLAQALPALWPRRLLGAADDPMTAWGDRFTTVEVAADEPQAPLAVAPATGSTTLRLAAHPACGDDPSCGFRRGDLAVTYDRLGRFHVSALTAVAGLDLTLGVALEEALTLPAVVAVATVRTIVFDADRRQLRRIDGLAASQPLLDEVVAFQVRYYGRASPPRWPSDAGQDTCVVAADGTPRLGLIGPVPGPPIELSIADLADGPWCGAGAWQYDADLLRAHAVRLRLRLQAGSPGVRGQGPLWFAMPGTARRPGREVRDVELDLFLGAPNLAWE